jgi:hypothetical protein
MRTDSVGYRAAVAAGNGECIVHKPGLSDVIAYLDVRVQPAPRPPEALEARWFPESAFPLPEIWEPISHFNMAELFERVPVGRFEYYQRTDDFHRVISERQQVRYLRRGRLK